MTDTLIALTQSDPDSPYDSNTSRATINACLTRIQRRLWAVRLAERLSLAVLWGAGVGITAAAARLLWPRNHWWALGALSIAIFAGVWLWLRTRQFGKGVLTPGLLCVAAALTGVVVIATEILLNLPGPAATLPAWSLLAGTITLFALAAIISVRMIDRRTAAIFVDQQAGLEERVSTALEFLEQPAPDFAMDAAFRAPVIESAVAACQQVKLAKVGYRRLSSRAYAAAATMALAAAGIALLHPLSPPPTIAQHKFIAVIDSAKKMSEVLNELDQKKTPKDEIVSDKIKPLEAKLAELKKGDMSPIEASALLDEAKAAMKRDQDAMKDSDKVAEALKAMEQTRDIAQAADPLKDARMQQAAGDANAAAKQQAAQQGADKAAQALADKMKNMSAADKQHLSQGLQNAANQAGHDPQLQRDLQNAASAASKGDSNQLAQSMKDAANRMGQQQADQAMSQEAVNRAMSEIDRMAGSGMSAGEQASLPAAGADQNQSGQQGGNSGQNGDQPNGGQNGNGQGQQNAQGDGQSGNGPGQQPGQGSGAQSANGQGQGGTPSPGDGSTNFEQRGGPGDKNAGTPIGRQGTFVRIYDQREIENRGPQERVTGKINPLGPAAGTSQVLGVGDKSDSQIKSYSEELPGAKQRVMDDLNKQVIPPQYQDMVKTFYEPDEDKKK